MVQKTCIIILNRLLCQISAVTYTVGNKYSVCDVICYVNYPVLCVIVKMRYE